MKSYLKTMLRDNHYIKRVNLPILKFLIAALIASFVYFIFVFGINAAFANILRPQSGGFAFKKLFDLQNTL